jgi:hypothetical protein
LHCEYDANTADGKPEKKTINPDWAHYAKLGHKNIPKSYLTPSTWKTAVRVRHMGKHEKWGTKHRCRMIKFSDDTRECHCICGDEMLNKVVKDDAEQLVPWFHEGHEKWQHTHTSMLPWLKHAHAEFLENGKTNKYKDYKDNQHTLEAKGKSRAPCNGRDEFGNPHHSFDHIHGTANTVIGDCDGIDSASICKAEHAAGSNPVTGHCDDESLPPRTHSPTHAPTPALGPAEKRARVQRWLQRKRSAPHEEWSEHTQPADV